MAVLASLMAGTSWAVASWVSPWLVPPYLILMTLLLSPSTGRPQGGSASEGSEASEALRPARPGEDPDDPDPDSDGQGSSEAPQEDGSEPGAAAKAPKARRGKGRVKKAKPTPELPEATWLQVAPGKFVRVEASDGSTAQAGPHSPVGTPVEVPTTPHGLEFEEDDPSGRPEGSPGGAEPLEGPFEDAGPAFDPLEGPEGDPTGEVESAASTDWQGDETAEPSRTIEGPSAADGNAPQAGGFFEASRMETPDVPLLEVEDRAWDAPQGEGTEEEDDPSSFFEVPEPTRSLALAEVPQEEMDEWGATFDGTDPTETPVDETDLDDAGPIEEFPPLEITTSTDADPSATESLPDPSDGPRCWPWRLAPRARTRVGPPLRSLDREATPRRPVRSHGPARRPPDPRRLARRGLARPRQVNRSFPPRSPPSRPIGRGMSFIIKFDILDRKFQGTATSLVGPLQGPKRCFLPPLVTSGFARTIRAR